MILWYLWEKPTVQGWSASSQILTYLWRMSIRSCVSWPTVTCCNRLVFEELVALDLYVITAYRMLSSSNGSSRPPRTTSSMHVSAWAIMRSVHGNGGTEEVAMSGNLFSLCLRTFIVNENGRSSLVLLGQYTAHVFIESCTIYGWVLFTGDVDNTLHLFLFEKRCTMQYNCIS